MIKKIILLIFCLQSSIFAQTGILQNQDINTKSSIETIHNQDVSNIEKIEKDYTSRLKQIEDNHKANISLQKQEFQSIKDSIEDRKTLYTVLASLVLFLVTAVFLFYGIRIYDVHSSFKQKESDYKNELKELKDSIERKFESSIAEKEKQLNSKILEIEENAKKTIKVIDDEAKNLVVKYMRELEKSKENGSGDSTDGSSDNNINENEEF